MLKSDIGEIFDDRQFIHDVSGAGNNWYLLYNVLQNIYCNSIFFKIKWEKIYLTWNKITSI